MGDASGVGWFVLFVLFVAALSLLGWWATWLSRGKERRFVREHAMRMAMLRRQGFNPEKCYFRRREMGTGRFVPHEYLIFDFSHGWFALERGALGSLGFDLYSLAKVYEAQVINESSVVQSSSSSHGGGLLLGVGVPGVGGFGGQSSSQGGEQTAIISVRVLMDDPRNPALIIPFLFGVVARASATYGEAASAAYEVYGIFESAIRQRNLAQRPAAQLQTGMQPAAAQQLAARTPPPPPPPAAKTCPKCGASSGVGAAFCSACGASVT